MLLLYTSLFCAGTLSNHSFHLVLVLHLHLSLTHFLLLPTCSSKHGLIFIVAQAQNLPLYVILSINIFANLGSCHIFLVLPLQQ